MDKKIKVAKRLIDMFQIKKGETIAITEENPVTNECVNQVYLFKQNRKMRSRELHYLDNPVFGMLVYVTPFKV